MKARKEEFHRARPPDTERLYVHKAAKHEHIYLSRLMRCSIGVRRGAHRTEQEQRKYQRLITRISISPRWKHIFFLFFLRHTQWITKWSPCFCLSQSRLRGCPRIDCGGRCAGYTHSVWRATPFIVVTHYWLRRGENETHTDPTLTCGVCESPGGDGAEWDDGFLFQSLECCWIAQSIKAVRRRDSPSCFSVCMTHVQLEENAVGWLISQNDLSGYQITKSTSFCLNLFCHLGIFFLTLYLSWERNQK
jgi:hypothetical protein